MTTRVAYLARHGETDWNVERRWQGQTDTPLNANGRAQAAALAQKLAECGVARVCSSDLSRARETAEIVAARLGLGAVACDPDLRERNFGVFEGLTFDECATKYPEMWARYLADRTRPTGAENDAALAERMIRGVGRALAGEGAVLIVTHGGSARAYLRAIGLLSPTDGTTVLPNGGVVRIEVP